MGRGAAMLDTQISTLFSGRLLQKILNNEPISLIEYNFLTSTLVARNIPFDAAFQPGTRKAAAALQLTVHINPSANFVIIISLEPGSNAFSPSPWAKACGHIAMFDKRKAL